jgi:hypothetical protein
MASARSSDSRPQGRTGLPKIVRVRFAALGNDQDAVVTRTPPLFTLQLLSLV